MVKESGDLEMAAWINNSFRSARGLHANFYENEESSQEVEQGLQLSEELSERLYQLFWARPAVGVTRFRFNPNRHMPDLFLFSVTTLYPLIALYH